MRYKLIVTEFLWKVKYLIEYINTFKGYIPIIKDELNKYNLNECDEILALQSGIWLPDYIYSIVKNISIVNTEQLTDSRHERQICEETNIVKQKCGYDITIYDYSSTNCEILEKHGFKTKFYPCIPIKEEIDYLHSLHNLEKIYDVGFVGTLSNRRKKILDELSSIGIKVCISTDFGQERDCKMAMCKYILNIRWCDDYKIFNHIRCNRLLQSGYKVISEESLEMCNSCNLFTAPYENLVEITKTLIEKEKNKIHSIDKSIE